MDANKEIKVYGTLVNWTHNNSIADDSHNDAIAYARQLYDDTFGDEPSANNFQDTINKRVTDIQYENGNTTITGDCTVDGDLLVGQNITSAGEVNGETLVISSTGSIGENLSVGGNATITGNVSAVNTDAAITTVNRLDADVNTPGSVKYQIEEVKTFIINKIVDGDLDPETIDCLVDIINWIDEHKDDAAAMLQDIQELKEGLQTETEDRLNGDANLNSKINSEKDNRISGDNALSDRVTALENQSHDIDVITTQEIDELLS